MSFKAGDIVGFQSPTAGYRKWHLCVNSDGWFLHLNSPTATFRPSDIEIDCSELPGVPPTPSGKSIISCNMVLRLTADKLELFQAASNSQISTVTAQKVLDHVKLSRVLSDIEKRPIITGLGGVVTQPETDP